VHDATSDTAATAIPVAVECLCFCHSTVSKYETTSNETTSSDTLLLQTLWFFTAESNAAIHTDDL
jgi:hypothetical protein